MQLHVEIWSDFACPWCYVGKRRFEAALASFDRRSEVVVLRRAFELDPGAPRVQEPRERYIERLARKSSSTPERAQRMIYGMSSTAEEAGLELRFDLIQPSNTFDAHRLQRMAEERGAGAAMYERLFRAYLSEGEAIGEPETLARLAADVGLDAGEVHTMLAGDDHARDVRADEARAHARGIHVVPHFRIADRDGFSGAQPPEVLLQALRSAWSELRPA